MPCYIRMKRIFLQGLLWLYLLGFGFMALSLEPGFLDFDNLPDTNFSCVGKVIGGYYADLETNCQMFHVCTIGQLDEPMDIRFLCLNGTVFDQETRVCERIDEVDCSKSEQFYSLNLELYGNTQPAILEESPETEQPLIIKSTTTTTTTTTTPKPKTTRVPFYTTVTSPTVTTAGNPQVISTHHFPIVNPSSTDVRFNPEEINISLHPGAPPDIRTKPVTYHQQSFSDSNTDTNKVIVTNLSDNKIIVTTHSADFENEKVLPNQGQGRIERPQTQVVSTTKKPHNYDNTHKTVASSYNRPTPSDINYEFSYHQTEPNEEYQTEVPQNFHFHSNFRPSQEYSGLHNSHAQHYQPSSYDNNYTPTTTKIHNYQPKVPTTIRNYYVQSLKPPPPPNQHQHYPRHQTEKPQRLQLPLPLLPTLPSLTFSSPAPFALQHHIETKRYTKDHQAPPRIIISASASVSDASGRRLNYSLGTIGAAQILQQPPQSYDEYKEDDVVLDPFYHDVPKIKRSRRKRSAEAKIKHSDIIRNEQEAVDVLKFLFEWYKNNEKSSSTESTVPTPDPVALEINNGFAPSTETNRSTVLPIENVDITTIVPNFKDSELFNSKSKYSIVGSPKENVTSQHKTIKKDHVSFSSEQTISVTTENTTKEGLLDELFHNEDDYVNDNFEPIAYKEKYGKEKEKSNKDQEFSQPIKEESKNLTADYVDDNVEPIYYRERSDSQNEDTKLINEDGKSTTGHTQTTVILKTEESGDTETNNINKEPIAQKVNTQNETTTARTINDKLKEVNTKKSVTVSSRSRSDRKRGRKRNHNFNDKEKEKEDHKNVVLERLTEKAHTAKDDFNYLRTLYKALSTTPLSHIPESSNVKATVVNKAGTTKEWSEDYNFFTQSVDATTPEMTAKVQEESRTEIPNFVPIITSEVTTSTTTEKPQVSRKDRRRGRQRHGGDLNHNRINLRSRNRTKQVTRESVPQLETSSAQYSTIVVKNENDKQNTQELELLESIKIDTNHTIPNLEYSVKPGNNFYFEGSTSKITDKAAPYSEITEATTGNPVTETNTEEEQTRGKVKFMHHESAIKSMYPLSRLDSSQEFGTPYFSTTELTDSKVNEFEKAKLEELSLTTPRIANSEDIQRRFSTIVDNDETTTDDLGTTSAYLSALFKETLKSFTPTQRVYNFPSGFTQSGISNQDYKYLSNVETVTDTPSTYWTTDRSELFSKDDYSSTITEEFSTTESNFNTPSTQWTTEKSRDDISTEYYSGTTNQGSNIVDSSGSPSSTVSENLPTTQLIGDKLKLYIENIEADTKSVVKSVVLPAVTESSTEESTPRVTASLDLKSETVQEEHGNYIKELPTTTEKDSRLEQLLEKFQNLTKGFFDSTRKNVIIPQTEGTYPSTLELTTLVVGMELSNNLSETTTLTQIPNTVELTTLLPIVETIKNQTKTTNFEELTSTIELTTLSPYELPNENHADSTQIPTTWERTTLRSTTQDEPISSTREETTQEVKANELITLLPSTDLSTLPPYTLHESTTLPKELTPFTTTDSTTLLVSYKYEPNPTTTVKSVVIAPENEPTSQPTVSELPVTMPTTVGTTKRGRGRRPNRRRNEGYRNLSRHRFSTEVFTKRPEDRRQTIEDEIIEEITRNSQESTTRALKRKRIKMRRGGGFDELSTDFPLRKSARPTQSERVKGSLPTTPLSKVGTIRKYFIFNCFGKEIDKFYPDPRDCRLFHYCTQGYNKNQLLDMKFVCDLNTYFDDKKLICTKSKPTRCL